MIAKSQISKLSNRLQKEAGGRRIPETVLERDYCIARFLVGLSRAPLRECLAFKGGTALKRCYFSDYRFSEDLNFTLLTATTFDELWKALETIYATVKDLSGITFRFVREDSQSDQNSYTFYLGYDGPLPNTTAGKEIKVDVTLKEHLSHQFEDLPVLKSYPEYLDLPEDARIKAYSLHEVATEKTVALLDRARTEPRDLFDLWHLTTESKRVDLSDFIDGIKAKLAFRKKTLDDVRDEFGKKESRLKKTWDSRLSMQMANLPEFDGVFRAVKRSLRQAGITSE